MSKRRWHSRREKSQVQNGRVLKGCGPEQEPLLPPVSGFPCSSLFCVSTSSAASVDLLNPLLTVPSRKSFQRDRVTSSRVSLCDFEGAVIFGFPHHLGMCQWNGHPIQRSRRFVSEYQYIAAQESLQFPATLRFQEYPLLDEFTRSHVSCWSRKI